MAWQPIATAPSDGTSVLVATPDGITTAAYMRVPGDPPVWLLSVSDHTYGCDGSDVVAPTHWMPLPDPPEGA